MHAKAMMTAQLPTRTKRSKLILNTFPHIVSEERLTHAKREFDRAIVDFTAILDVNPNDAFTYGRRGSAYWLKGNYDRAIADFTKQIEIEPNNPEAYRGRSLAYADKRDKRVSSGRL